MSQRFVVTSSFRQLLKVESRSESGRHCRSASRARGLSDSLRTRCDERPRVFNAVEVPEDFVVCAVGSFGRRRARVPQEAAHNVLQQPRGGLLDERADQVREHRAHGVEALGSRANVGEAGLIEENLLDDEGRHSL